jgi:hypothetical protein
MVQLCAAQTPTGDVSNTTQWSGGRPSLIAADSSRCASVSMPSSAVTSARKKPRRPMRSSAARTAVLRRARLCMRAAGEQLAPATHLASRAF